LAKTKLLELLRLDLATTENGVEVVSRPAAVSSHIG
jgi:hypothetical protein